MCIVSLNSFIESLIDNRYHIPLDKGLKLISDFSRVWILWSINKELDQLWLFGKKCHENMHLSLFENGKRPRNNNSSKHVSKVDSKTNKIKKQEIVDNLRYYHLNYLSFLCFRGELSDQV
jgi:hypothetical protein